MSRYAKAFAVFATVALFVLFTGMRTVRVTEVEHDSHAEEHVGDHDAAHHDEHRAFTVEDFEKAGVRLLVAGPGEVDAAIELPGEVRPNGDRIAHLAPRFAGIVREVRKYVGDRVRAGEVLAVVESENLSLFEVRSAFDAVVIEKHVTPGEAVIRERPVFVVADLSSVWVDISIYHTALPNVHVGRQAGIRAAHGKLEAVAAIAYVTPVVDPATRTATARVVLPNPDGQWRPGLFVSATILTPESASVVIPHDAVQTIEGKAVVFVAEADRFEPREITLGRRGRTNVEISSGLNPGERYAAERSFLVKAELTKGEAGHAD